MPVSSEKPPLYPILLASTCGSMSVVLTCTPFDVIKNFWQGSPQLNHQRNSFSTISIIKRLIKTQGALSLWRGTGVSLMYVIPNSATYWSLYEYQKSQEVPVYLAAASSRVVAQLCFSPLEFLRTKVQACVGEEGVDSFRDLGRRVLKEEGVWSFWRGVGATLCRDVPFSMIYFGLYEYTRTKIYAEQTSSSFFMSLFLGAGCSAVATVATHPFDVVKTQLQSYNRVQPGGRLRLYAVSEALLAVKNEYGLIGLFRIGLAPRLLKVMPASGLMLATYEAVRNFTNRLHD